MHTVQAYAAGLEPDVRMNPVLPGTDATGCIAGTYCHGLFDTKAVVSGVVNALRKSRGLPDIQMELIDRQQALNNDLNHLAAVCRAHLDMHKIMNLLSNIIDQ